MKVTLKSTGGRSAVRVVAGVSAGGGARKASGLDPALAEVVRKADSTGIFSGKKGEVLPLSLIHI